jgi:hypothetical protein
VAGDAAHPRKKFAGEIEIALVGYLVTEVAKVAVPDAEAVFQNELKGGASGFRDVQEKNHDAAYGF